MWPKSSTFRVQFRLSDRPVQGSEYHGLWTPHFYLVDALSAQHRVIYLGNFT
jgi:hypothetical protein